MSDIKLCFPSRFKDGVIFDADFSQLEVIAAAILSGDSTLIMDIKSGLDMHRKRAAELFKKREVDVTKEERRIAKTLSFLLQYGGGADALAKKTGIDKALAEEFIRNYYARYWVLKNWQDQTIEEVKLLRQPTSERTPGGLPRGKAKWESPTGRIYTFKEHDPPEWLKKKSGASFSPTQIKNFPIQGFATGDVMAIFRGMVYDELFDNDFKGQVLPINTVHDSIMFDLEDERDVPELFVILKCCSSALPEVLQMDYDIDCHGLTFPIEAKYGKNWGQLDKEIK